MQITIELPEAIYLRALQLAQNRGHSFDELLAGLLDRELKEEPITRPVTKRASLPIMKSKNPGILDLSNFDFDDLLAWDQA